MILRTEAPYSASVRDITGPAITRLRSRTLIPVRIWGFCAEEDTEEVVKGAGSESDSNISIENNGSLLSAFPCVEVSWPLNVHRI